MKKYPSHKLFPREVAYPEMSISKGLHERKDCRRGLSAMLKVVRRYLIRTADRLILHADQHLPDTLKRRRLTFPMKQRTWTEGLATLRRWPSIISEPKDV